MARYSFDDKIALVTGGSRGLGFLIARELIRKGAKAILLARDLDELARAQTDLGEDALGIQCDLSDPAQIRFAVEETLARFSKIDIIVNNAGIIEVGPLPHMLREDFERAMRLHFWAPYELISQVIPIMQRQGGGRIVNIASIGGKVAVPHMAPYSASKFALVGLSDAFRAELASDNIFVTTVTPGLMRTGSEVHAKFKGDHVAEFKAFSTAGKVPFASISAERAAEKIVAACARGQTSLVMPFTARLLIIANAVFPRLTGRIMQWMNRSLAQPVGPHGNELRAGSELK